MLSRYSLCHSGRYAGRFLRPLSIGSSSRCASTLTLLETTKEGKVAPSSLSVLKAAEQLGNPITALFIGSKSREAAEKLKSSVELALLKKILVSEHHFLDYSLPEDTVPLLVKLLQNDAYTHFLMASSAIGKNILPRVGALLDLQPISDITAIKDSTTFVRPVYAGNIITTVQCTQAKKLITVRSSAFEPVAQGSTESIVIEAAPEIEPTVLNIVWEKSTMLQTERPDLGSARVVVAGGRAFKDKETFDKLLTPLADVLNAGIGATRAAVDNGFCDNSLQVGQTGKVVAPDLYVAAGISGAIQHLAGMKDSKVIVAVNSDPDAPIFKIADYSLEGDIFKVIPELTDKLSKLLKK